MDEQEYFEKEMEEIINNLYKNNKFRNNDNSGVLTYINPTLELIEFVIDLSKRNVLTFSIKSDKGFVVLDVDVIS